MMISIIVLFILSPRFIWEFKSSVPLNVLVVDKTVPNTEYREHNGLFWFLINDKIVKPNDELYDIGIDYHGYDPYEGKAMEPLVAEGSKDVIYIADTYGVYSDDLEDSVEGDRSEKVYGGMDIVEWNSLMQMKGTDTILIAEYNSFASPTDESTRKIMSRNLGVSWSGWSGRFFTDFTNDEVPPWLIRNYEEQYKKKWSFENGGLAFVNTSDQVVLIDEKEMTDLVQFKMTEEGRRMFDRVKDSDYHYWFDIVTPSSNSVVLAEYELLLSDTAKRELQHNQIPLNFPAITHNELNKTYYFSGDFADYTKDNMVKWHRGDILMNIFSNDESTFFWSTYIPLMRQIFGNIK